MVRQVSRSHAQRLTPETTWRPQSSTKVDAVRIGSPDLESGPGWLLKFNWDFLVQRYVYDKIFMKMLSVFFPEIWTAAIIVKNVLFRKMLKSNFVNPLDLSEIRAVASLGGWSPGRQLRVSPVYFFLKNLATFFVVLVASSAVSPLTTFFDFLTTFFAHRFLLLSLGCLPPRWCLLFFYLSDLVSPLFFVNLPTKFFSFGCHRLEGVTRGGSPPSPP